jgi:DNA-binding NarL/FixJ family response regulator
MAEARKKILYIEDDRQRATQVAEQLVDRGFKVDVAHDGHEGFVAILKDKPDLVVCDISTPAMPGLEMLARLTEIAPEVRDVPFVFLAEPTEHNGGRKRGRVRPDDCVTKPFDFDVLTKIINGRLVNTGRAKLNDREIETLTRVARGKTSAEIARELGMVKRTVDFHVDNARMKLGATTRTAAASKAVAAGLIEP